MASCSIISECTHCIFFTVLHCNTLTLGVHMPRGWCMYTHKYFCLCLYPVNTYGHTIIVAYVCVWFVVNLTHKGNADIQHPPSMFRTKPVLLLKSNTSCVSCFCDSPLAVLCPLLYKYLFSYLYRNSYNSTLIQLRFYIDVCSLKSNCHACIFCVLYGVFEIFINRIIFYLKDIVCMRYKREL